MTIPRDVSRFEILLYLSLILDCLSAAFFGPSGASAEVRASLSVVNALLITGFFALVWVAAQRRKNWARWTLFGFFVFTVVVYIASIGELSFGVQTLIDMVSLALSAFAFYFGFTSQAQQWFKASNTYT